MNTKNSELYFVLTIIAAVSIFTFFIFKPFLYSIVLALVIATVFKPVHDRIERRMKGKPATAAFLATLLIAFIIIIPLTFLAIQIFKEVSYVYSFLTSPDGAVRFAGMEAKFVANIKNTLPVPKDFSIDLSSYLKGGLSWFLANIGLIFSNIARILLSTFVFMLALYYFLKEGKRIRRDIMDLSPLTEGHNQTVLNKLKSAVNSVIKGSLTVALVQGLLTSIGFIIFGVPNAALWGSVTAIAALVPSVGTALVIVPAVLFLFFSGNIVSAVGLLAWGVVAVGLVDNFLGPKLVEKGTDLHPFLILLSILGGITIFGAVGFVLGPLTLALLFAFFDIYTTIRGHHGTKESV